MGRKHRVATLITITITILLLLTGQVLVVQGQENGAESLSLRLRRNFGYGLGSQMQGTFSIQVDGPEDLAKVEFLLDGVVIGEDNEAPFSIGFNTRDYPEGVHKFSAVGTKADGEQLQSQTISRQFVATSSVTILVIAIVVLVIAFRVASYFLARRSSGSRAKSGSYGFPGAAVCPNCGRPFGIHWWSLRLGLGRYDRCPHCRKWNMVKRASADAVVAAEDCLNGKDRTDAVGDTSRVEDDMRRRIEESRYDQGQE